MSETVVSVRVDTSIHEQMKLHDEINWSAILRNSIIEELDNLEKIDVKKAEHAAKTMDALRKSRAFDHGKSGVEIIREWREKRR